MAILSFAQKLICIIFSRVHATLQPTLSVGLWLVGWSVGHTQGRAICIGYCIVFTILVSIGFTQYLLWVLFFFPIQYNTI